MSGVGSNVSALRFRVSFVELLKPRNVFVVDNFEVVNDDAVSRFDDNDVVVVVICGANPVGLIEVEGVERKLLVVDFNVELLVDKRELVVGNVVFVDDDVDERRLEPFSKELPLLIKLVLIVVFGAMVELVVELVGFKSELFVESNDEDDRSVFFGSVIFAI